MVTDFRLLASRSQRRHRAGHHQGAHRQCGEGQAAGGAAARDFPHEREPCPVGSDRALDNALITAPEARDPELLKRLDAVAGSVLECLHMLVADC